MNNSETAQTRRERYRNSHSLSTISSTFLSLDQPEQKHPCKLAPLEEMSQFQERTRYRMLAKQVTSPLKISISSTDDDPNFNFHRRAFSFRLRRKISSQQELVTDKKN